jgi:hypothetical protein
MIRTSPTTFLAYEAIPAGARVKLRAAGVVELADAADQEIGHALLHSGKSSYPANTPVGVQLINQPGTVTALAGGNIAAGDKVYRTGDGKVLGTADGACIGTAFEAGADGDWIEILRDPTLAVVPADGSVTAAKLAAGGVGAAALADAVADAVITTTIAAANTGTPNGVAHVTGQVKDAQGNALAGTFLVTVTSATSAGGAPSDRGDVAAAANSLIVVELVPDALIVVRTHTDGSWGLDFDTTANETVHFQASLGGKTVATSLAVLGN